MIGEVSTDDRSLCIGFGPVFWELLGILPLRRLFWAPAACDFVSRHNKKLVHIMGIFLCIGLNVCIVRSIESSHGDGFFECSLLAIFVDY